MKRLAVVALFSASLAACGGGGGGTSVTPVSGSGSGITPKTGVGGGTPYVYVGNLSVLDAVNEQTLQLVWTQNKGAGCPNSSIAAMALSHDDAYLYVEGFAGDTYPNDVTTQLATSSNTVVQQLTFPMSFSAGQAGFSVSDDNSQLFAPDNNADAVQRYTVASHHLTTDKLGGSDNFVGVPVQDPGNGLIYVVGDVYPSGGGQPSAAIYTINPSTDAVALAFTAPSTSEQIAQIAFDPAGTTLFEEYSASVGSNPVVRAVDPTTFAVKYTMTPSAQMPWFQAHVFAVSPRGDRVYAMAGAAVDAFSTSNGALITQYTTNPTYSSQQGFSDIAVTGDGQYVFLSAPTYSTVNLISINATTAAVAETTLTYPSGYVGLTPVIAAM